MVNAKTPPEPDAQHMGTLWMLRLDRPLPESCVSYISATFLSTGPEIAGELASVMGFDNDGPVLQRFQLARHCYIARIEGRIVAYGWITFDEELIGGLGLRVRLLPGEAYIWDCGTLPEYRGQHLYPALLSHMQRELQIAGLWRAWIGMDSDNLPSQAGVRRAGFQPIVDILQARHTSERTLLTRGCPGALLEDVQAAQYALFGDREASGMMVAGNDG